MQKKTFHHILDRFLFLFLFILSNPINSNGFCLVRCSFDEQGWRHSLEVVLVVGGISCFSYFYNLQIMF